VAPYSIVSAELAMTLSGLQSPASFEAVAQAAFAKTLVATSAYMSLASQITFLRATWGGAPFRRRRLQQSGARQPWRSLDSGNVTILFTIEVNVNEASGASGKAYSIAGPSSDDEWASSNDTLALAIALVGDVTSALSNATESSLWEVTAQRVIDSIPLLLTHGSPLDLSAVPGGVSFDPASVRVTVCKWNSLCEGPTPSPTIPHPSPVPTSSPTEVPEYWLRMSYASVPFVFLALLQVVVGATLVCKHMQRARAKAKARSDAGQAAEKVQIQVSAFNFTALSPCFTYVSTSALVS
jgi:hypothetical protein